MKKIRKKKAGQKKPRALSKKDLEKVVGGTRKKATKRKTTKRILE